MIKQFESKAKLQYYGDYCVAYVDEGIVKFYRSLIPKSRMPQPQAWPAHITVLRRAKESIVRPEVWGKYQGQEVSFSYTNEIHNDELYFWINAWSKDIGDIREELGLERYRPPFHSYHISLGNMKVQP